MKKAVLIFLFLSFIFNAKSQSLGFDLGFSTYSGGLGIQTELNLWKLGMSFGIGTDVSEDFMQTICFGGGLRFYFLDTNIGSPYFGASYWRTRGVSKKINGVVVKKDVYYGPSLGGGFKFLLGKTKNIVIRTGLFLAYLPEISDYYTNVDTSAKWVIAPDISIGYCFNLSK